MKKISYEEALKQLDEIVGQIEDPKRNLTTTGEDVKKAMELIKYCKELLRGDQEKIEKIINES
ncbi:MAG: exodeoxyribonuclease VII small subunit [Bacteroidales bacterium]|nr:exodeoxyribonuclease VII small subunit [Bacteroidales bacterium]